MQIRDELVTMRWRSNNGFSCPIVIRTAYGGYIAGGAIYHSQTGASLFTANPGCGSSVPRTPSTRTGC